MSEEKRLSTIIEIREKAKMSRKQFVEYFNIPYRTVQDWELGNRKCPDYLIELIEYKLKKENKTLVIAAT